MSYNSSDERDSVSYMDSAQKEELKRIHLRLIHLMETCGMNQGYTLTQLGAIVTQMQDSFKFLEREI